jgi:hypothetical protein
MPDEEHQRGRADVKTPPADRSAPEEPGHHLSARVMPGRTTDFI